MKKTLLTLAIATITQLSYAQFSSSGGNTTTSDKVGIGTTSPNHLLEISSGTSDPFYFNGTYNKMKSSAGFTFIESFHGTSLVIDATGSYSDRFFNIAKGASYINGGSPVELFRVQENGNVGIGTTSPGSKLDVNGDIYTRTRILSDAFGGYSGGNVTLTTNTGGAAALVFNTALTENMRITSVGNVGIGTTSPVVKLDVNGSINIPSNDNLTWGGTYGAGIPTISANNSVGLCFYPGGSTSGVGMAINPSGNVLIGKTSQANTNYKLDVNGSARANEIVVNTTGADFVFEKNYKLPKLEEVEAYIKKKHHLIDIPTADVMKQYGVAVGELNTKLLQKVEELTLYLIDKDYQDKEKDAKLQSQQEQINQLKEQLTAITKSFNKN